MKILHLDSFNGFGGGQKRYSSIAEELVKKNHKEILISRKNSKVDNIFPGKIYSAFYLGDLDIFTFFIIFFIVLREKPDIIHTHSHQDHWFGGIISKFFLKIKLVHTRHVDFPIENNFINKLMYNKLTDYIITSCKAIKNTLVRSFPDLNYFENKIYPVLTINPPEKMGRKNRVRKELGIEDKIVVSIITRLVDWKGHKYLLKAVPLILKEIENIRFLIVGSGPYLTELKKLVSELEIEKYVIFTGFRQDIEDIYADTDISVLPSEMESPGVSIAESIFHETPVITSNVGGIPELVSDGFNGFLVEVGNYREIAKKVIKLVNDKKFYKKIKNNCKKWKKERLAEKSPAEKMEALYYRFIK